MHVTGHKVLITGGSSGIGFALARELLARENDVFITARGADRLQAAARQLPGAAAECSDVSDERSLRTLVDTAVGAMGGLTMLVNNAGVQFNDRYGETETETVLRHVEEEIGTNLLGLVKLTALAVPHLRQQPDSAVVNVSSLLAIAPKQSAPVYCATKAAVTSFSQSLRYQLEEISPPIRVFDVLPPMVDTEMTRHRTGRKLAPERVADDIVRGLERDRFTILIGDAKKLAWANRVSPRWAQGLVRRR